MLNLLTCQMIFLFCYLIYKSDRLSYERLNKVGQIEVECWEAELKTSEWKVRKKSLDFTQANKKDSYGVTNGMPCSLLADFCAWQCKKWCISFAFVL